MTTQLAMNACICVARLAQLAIKPYENDHDCLVTSHVLDSYTLNNEPYELMSLLSFILIVVLRAPVYTGVWRSCGL